ncbi:hypothetical protein V6N13_143840 [Hibiscus sabdariffa]
MRLHLSVALICATVSLFAIARAEDPYRFFTWNVTYGDIFPLGVRQTDLRAQLDGGKTLPLPDGILINGRGPGGASFNVEQEQKSEDPRPKPKPCFCYLFCVLGGIRISISLKRRAQDQAFYVH